MVKIGVVGCGYWGPNLIRVLAELRDAQLSAICDLSEDRLNYAKRMYPLVRLTSNYKELLSSKEIDAVVLATPPETHFPLAQEFLSTGKHLLVEKPLALKSSECESLIEIAKKNGAILMSGHTFVYNAAVGKMKEYIDKGELGNIYYIYSSRLNLGKVRTTINALWNFAPHDISIILYLLGEEPASVSTVGHSYLQSDLEDVVFMNLRFKSGVSANIHVSWLDPHKVRRMTVVGSKKMVVYDDVSPEAKITVYDKGIDKITDKERLKEVGTFGDFQLLLRTGDVHIPKINFVEPLKTECAHFVDCIKNGKRPITDGYAGLGVVRILESAQESMKKGGVPMNIERVQLSQR